MVEKIFKCIVCDKTTISPKSHILTHTLDDIIDCFVNLTFLTEESKVVVHSTPEKVQIPNNNTVVHKTVVHKDLTDWDLNA